MVAINSAEEQSFINNTILTGANEYSIFWIGLTDQRPGEYSTWVTGEPVTFAQWKFDEPNNVGGVEHWICLNWNYFRDGPAWKGSWNDAPLNGTSGYGFGTDGPYRGIIEISQQIDIEMQSAQLVNGNTVQFTYATTGNPGPFPVAVFRSANSTFDLFDQQVGLGVTTPGPTGQPTTDTVQFNPFSSLDLPYLLVVADPVTLLHPSFGEIDETDDVNNNAVIVPLPDLLPTAPAWNPNQGGFSFSYEVKNAAITEDATVSLYWASGVTFGDVQPMGDPIRVVAVDTTEAKTVGVHGPFHVSGDLLRNAPSEATHLLVKSTALLTEANTENNTAILRDVQLAFGPNANREALSAYTVAVIKELLRSAGEATATITSTFRSAEDQARAMIQVIESPPTAKGKKIVTGLERAYQLYNHFGDLVIDVYVELKAQGKSSEEILRGMADKILEIKSKHPHAFAHTADFKKTQVIDIAPSSISNTLLFESYIISDARITRHFSPYTDPFDPAFHLEIAQ